MRPPYDAVGLRVVTPVHPAPGLGPSGVVGNAPGCAGRSSTDLVLDAVLRRRRHPRGGRPARGRRLGPTGRGRWPSCVRPASDALGAGPPGAGRPGRARRPGATSTRPPSRPARPWSAGGLGLVPRRVGAAVEWTAYAARARQLPDVGEADRGLRARRCRRPRRRSRRPRRRPLATGGRGRADEPPPPLRGSPPPPGTAGALRGARRPGAPGAGRSSTSRSRTTAVRSARPRPPADARRSSPWARRRAAVSSRRARLRSGPNEDAPTRRSRGSTAARAAKRARSRARRVRPGEAGAGRPQRAAKRACSRAEYDPSTASGLIQTASSLPAGSVKWNRRPPGNSNGSSSIVAPAARTASSVASRSSL